MSNDEMLADAADATEPDEVDATDADVAASRLPAALRELLTDLRDSGSSEPALVGDHMFDVVTDNADLADDELHGLLLASATELVSSAQSVVEELCRGRATA